MGTHRLIPHPDRPPRGVHGVEVRWFEPDDGRVILRYQVSGAEALSIPAFAGKGRGDELWRTTCCELFLKDGDGEAYTELNFSPSERWAAYRFSACRQGMAQADLSAAPEISSAAGQHLFVLTAVFDAGLLAGMSRAGLSAVIEEKDGTVSYWALAHPIGPPDFHDPACFALPLAAAG